MDFIVLPYGIKSPLSMEYNATFVSKIANITNQIIKIRYFTEMHYFSLDPSILTVKMLCNQKS